MSLQEKKIVRILLVVIIGTALSIFVFIRTQRKINWRLERMDLPRFQENLIMPELPTIKEEELKEWEEIEEELKKIEQENEG